MLTYRRLALGLATTGALDAALAPRAFAHLSWTGLALLSVATFFKMAAVRGMVGGEGLYKAGEGGEETCCASRSR